MLNCVFSVLDDQDYYVNHFVRCTTRAWYHLILLFQQN